MKQFIILPVIAGMMATTGCTAKGVTKAYSWDPSNLDTTVACGDDFYQYACGGWMKQNPIKPEYARFGSFDQLRENNREQIKGLIEELGKQKNETGSVAQKIGDMYNMGLDSVRLNHESVIPLSEILVAINKAQNNTDISRLMAKLQRTGISSFFEIFIDADAKNSSMNITSICQGGISMGDRDYYLQNDTATTSIRNKYRQYIAQLFTIAGYSPAEAKKAEESVMKIETALAKASFSREELRDPQKNYNKMSVDEFKKQVGGIDWNTYFQEIGLGSIKDICNMQVPFMKVVGETVKSLTPDEMKYYLTYNLLGSASSYLSDDFYNASFDFYEKTLSGKKEKQPRWKRSLSTTSDALSEAVGQMYVQKYFPAEAKNKMLQLVGNLQVALGQHIDSLEWMSDVTKAKAKEKLATFHVKVGYPDKWRDYSQLNINPKDSYWANICRVNEFDFDYMLKDVDKPVDKEKWLMSPQTVNAYYNPSTNEICFPAAILQPPFFYMNADDAVNYGAIGVVIGHEMTHGFDDQGRQFDKEGNLADWWTSEDAKQFEVRANKLADHYSKIIVLDSVHANGAFTLGENIADQGGLRVSYTAFQNSQADKTTEKIDGFTPEQRFYLAYASLWAGNIRNEEILRLTKIDPHSLGKWRVNAALRNVDSFFKAFNITEKDPMYLAPEDRVVIW